MLPAPFLARVPSLTILQTVLCDPHDMQSRSSWQSVGWLPGFARQTYHQYSHSACSVTARWYAHSDVQLLANIAPIAATTDRANVAAVSGCHLTVHEPASPPYQVPLQKLRSQCQRDDQPPVPLHR